MNDKDKLLTKADALTIFATQEDFANLRGELEAKMAQMESHLTLRMFYFWMGQVAVIAGLLAYFFHINK